MGFEKGGVGPIISRAALSCEIHPDHISKLPTVGTREDTLRRQETGVIRPMMASLLQLQRSGLELIVPPALKALCEWGCQAPAAALSEHLKEVLAHVGTMLKYAQSNHAAAAENSDLMAATKYMIRPLQEGREGNRGRTYGVGFSRWQSLRS